VRLATDDCSAESLAVQSSGFEPECRVLRLLAELLDHRGLESTVGGQRVTGCSGT